MFDFSNQDRLSLVYFNFQDIISKYSMKNEINKRKAIKYKLNFFKFKCT